MHIFVKRDLDGFFGLAIDNLVQLLLIVSLCGAVCGMSGREEFYIYRYILPGAAVSLLIGNIFYALQAHWVARREQRSDVTALPYGINTPSLIIYIFFVMKPAYDRALAAGSSASQAAHLAWQLGLVACLGSGLIEFFGAFVAERLRRNTPRAALLSTLAGIAIAFISMTFALRIWQFPLVAMLPLGIIMLTYFARVRFPLGLPGGFVAVLVGTAVAWLLSSVAPGLAEVPMSADDVRAAWARSAVHTGDTLFWPQWVGPQILAVLRAEPAQILSLLSVIIPMGLFNLIGSLQNIESAEAGGDVFATGPSLAVNGIGTLAAACFGSCFPTTIYIGHPGWKALGARAGYSTLNGLFISAICLTGTVLAIARAVPIEAGIAIVLWIGIIITAQAFQATPLRHAPAVAIGLFPAIAAWGATVVSGAFMAAAPPPPAAPATSPVVASSPADVPAPPAATPPPGPAALTIQDLLEGKVPNTGPHTEVNGFLLHGLNILERGYIFTCMIVAAIAAFLIDRRFKSAAVWCLAAAVLTALGLMHAYQLSGNIVDYLPLLVTPTQGAFHFRAFHLAAAYALLAGLFALIARWHRPSPDAPAENTIEAARVAPATGSDEEPIPLE